MSFDILDDIKLEMALEKAKKLNCTLDKCEFWSGRIVFITKDDDRLIYDDRCPICD